MQTCISYAFALFGLLGVVFQAPSPTKAFGLASAERFSFALSCGFGLVVVFRQTSTNQTTI